MRYEVDYIELGFRVAVGLNYNPTYNLSLLATKEGKKK